KVELSSDENYIINQALDLNEKISAVVVQIESNQSKILIWGSNETNRVWQNSISKDFENKPEFVEKTNSQQMVESTNQSDEQKATPTSFDSEDFSIQTFNDESLDDNDYSDFETDEEIEKIVDQSLNKFQEVEDEIEEVENNSNNKSEFLNSVEEQINELLNNYEEEKALENIIPNSKFVKVNSSGENFYIFGVIYENDIIKYIVYGLPGEFSVKPDDEYANFYQWLPLNSENPQGYGYYLMYQDALNGNQVEVILD
ncbi:MAG: hypothetical protein ACI4TI_00400, partial [Christensenellales bacterium]